MRNFTRKEVSVLLKQEVMGMITSLAFAYQVKVARIPQDIAIG